MKKLLSITLSLLMIVGVTFALAACGEKQEKKDESSTESSVPTESSEVIPAAAPEPIFLTTEEMEKMSQLPNPEITIEMEDGGKIVLELYPQLAPNTVNNFISLAESGFYDGVVFHRIVPNFMIQGGDPDGTGSGGPGYRIAGEFSSNGFTQNTLSHTEGVISMARSNHPDSAGSQFFICDGNDATFLDGQYAAFGKVTENIELVKEIALDEARGEMAVKPRVIKTITVDKKGIEEWPAPKKLG